MPTAPARFSVRENLFSIWPHILRGKIASGMNFLLQHELNHRMNQTTARARCPVGENLFSIWLGLQYLAAGLFRCKAAFA